MDRLPPTPQETKDPPVRSVQSFLARIAYFSDLNARIILGTLKTDALVHTELQYEKAKGTEGEAWWEQKRQQLRQRERMTAASTMIGFRIMRRSIEAVSSSHSGKTLQANQAIHEAIRYLSDPHSSAFDQAVGDYEEVLQQYGICCHSVPYIMQQTLQYLYEQLGGTPDNPRAVTEAEFRGERNARRSHEWGFGRGEAWPKNEE